LNAIGREGLYDPVAFKFWLSDAGYGTFEITEDVLTPEDLERIPGLRESLPLKSEVEFLAEAYERMAARKEWEGIKGIAQRLYKKGRIDADQLRRYYRMINVSDVIIDLTLELLDAEMEEEEKDASVSTYRWLFERARIPEEEYRRRLEEAGEELRKILLEVPPPVWSPDYGTLVGNLRLVEWALRRYCPRSAAGG